MGKSNITKYKINKNNISIQNNGHTPKNNILSIVQTDTQVHCSPLSTRSRDTKNIKSILPTIANLTAVNSETKYQQNICSSFSPNTIILYRKHVESFTYNTNTVFPSMSLEVIDNPT